MSDGFTLSGDSSAEQLKAIFARLKGLDDETQAIAAEKREVIAAAKVAGFVGPVLTLMIRRARKDPAAIMEGDALLDTYEAITGTGGGSAGTLEMKRNAEGVFEAKMIQGGGPETEAKLTKSARARRSASTAAALAAKAREEL